MAVLVADIPANFTDSTREGRGRRGRGGSSVRCIIQQAAAAVAVQTLFMAASSSDNDRYLP